MKAKYYGLKEKLRLDGFEVMSSPFHDLMMMCLGQGIINNPKIVRMDDITSTDIVFYEKEE